MLGLTGGEAVVKSETFTARECCVVGIARWWSKYISTRKNKSNC